MKKALDYVSDYQQASVKQVLNKLIPLSSVW